MFNKIIGVVNSPQFVIDSCDLALAFGEFEDFTSQCLQSSMEDIFNFHIDMMMGEITPIPL